MSSGTGKASIKGLNGTQADGVKEYVIGIVDELSTTVRVKLAGIESRIDEQNRVVGQ